MILQATRAQGPEHDLNPTVHVFSPQIQEGTWSTGPQCFTSSTRLVRDHSSFRLTGKAMRIVEGFCSSATAIQHTLQPLQRTQTMLGMT